jgi:hypothetical protein
VLILTDWFISQALALLEKPREERATESAKLGKIVELEVVTKSQANRITVLETTCADLTHEKNKLTNGYRRLLDKHKALTEKTE